MTAELVHKLSEIKDLKSIVETTVVELGQSLHANCCQILLANPLDLNSAVIFENYSADGSAENSRLGGEDKFPRLTLPLDINGRGFGTVCLSRSTPWLEEEVDSTRLLLGKIGEIVRQAQLNDIAQRETFRDTFLVEINNLMTYSLGVGDALFMVVNILGKALRCSRCIFVCTDDKNSGWKCYEYWQQDKVKSCQEYRWPTNDSALIAQTISSRNPIKFYEGQTNSYLTPAQAELQFSNTRSLLALPLLSENNVYGCVIIQQCDYRRDWTINEIDTVQSVADRVSEALAKLPEEKRIHKPIMQLHQRMIAAKTTEGAAGSIAQSLKGAFGQQSIPSAKDNGKENKIESKETDKEASKEAPGAQHKDTAKDTLTELPAQGDTLTSISLKTPPDAAGQEVPDSPPPSAPIAPKEKPSLASLIGAKKKLGKKDSPSQENPSSPPSIVSVQRKDKSKDPGRTSNSSLEAIKQSPRASKSDLDAIPTPAPGPGLTGLGASMIPKAKVQQTLASDSPLSASLHKNKALTATDLPSQKQATARAAYDSANSNNVAEDLESTLPPAMAANTGSFQGDLTDLNDTDSQAREKVERVLSSKSEAKTTSEYIFALKDVDLRTLGRINGWVEAIEQKDRYLTPHAVSVAENAYAIAKAINLPAKEAEEIKLAALVHDVGKLGIPGEILQKRDEDLDDAELLTTMKHPIDGAELLKGAPDLASLAPIVLAHHEEFGGNGYPQGLKEEEIPIGARIIYLANSYHAMISDTRNQKGMSADEAQAQLEEESGKQYDPALVKAFLKHLRK